MLLFFLWLLGVGLTFIFESFTVDEEEFELYTNEAIMAAILWPIVLPVSIALKVAND